MYIIGENIHIISQKVKDALRERDASFFQDLAVRQVEAGAQALDFNLGPRKKDGEEVFPWLVEIVEAVVDVPLSFDTTNLLGIEAGLKKVTKAQPIINSTSAEPERLEKVPLLAKQYSARLIALTMGKSGIPVGADERVEHCPREPHPALHRNRFPDRRPDHRPPGVDRFWLPGILPGADRSGAHHAVRLGPAPADLGWSFECVQCRAAENRPLINQVYCAMLMGAGLADDDRRSAG